MLSQNILGLLHDVGLSVGGGLSRSWLMVDAGAGRLVPEGVGLRNRGPESKESIE